MVTCVAVNICTIIVTSYHDCDLETFIILYRYSLSVCNDKRTLDDVHMGFLLFSIIVDIRKGKLEQCIIMIQF